jgi:uncharacterized protein YndB with AHSA1/START domain
MALGDRLPLWHHEAVALTDEGLAMREITLTTSWVFASPRKAVYDAWLDPRTLPRFISHDPDLVVGDVRIAAHAEGRYHYVLTGEGRTIYQGTYLELDPPTTLSFTWDVAGSPPGSIVSLNFRPVAEGSQISLTHAGFSSSLARDLQLLRWEAVLRNLAALF